MVERLIQEAMQAGKFDDLRGRGQPADLSAYFETPADVRLAQVTLQNAGFVPREVELLNDIAELKAQCMSSDVSGPTSEDLKRLRRLELELSVLMDRNRSRWGRSA